MLADKQLLPTQLPCLIDSHVFCLVLFHKILSNAAGISRIRSRLSLVHLLHRAVIRIGVMLNKIT